MIVAAGTKALWYFTRASGAVSLVLLTVSFLFGIPTLLSTATRRFPRLVIQLLHRNLSLLVTVFLGLHIVTAVVDGFVTIRWIDVVVPFRAAYRPIWLGLGAVAFDLLLAVIITSLLRVHIGYRTWQYVHLSTYALWPIALVHGLGSGSDTRSHWMWWLAGACTLVVAGAVVWRLIARPPIEPRLRLTAVSLLVLVPMIGAFWLVRGPLQPGWGKKTASTPTTTEVTIP
jgi:methionine sulfoxide reductase heme-binding subunit